MRRYTFLLLITPLFFAVCQGDENGVGEIREGNGLNVNLVRNPAMRIYPWIPTTWRVLSTQWLCVSYVPPTKLGYNNATFNNAITDIESIIVPSITI